MIRVIIIGSGGVAEALAKGIARCESLELVQVWGRNQGRVEAISREAGCALCDKIQEADIYIIAVSDRAIEEVSSGVDFASEAIVIHTAGSVEMSKIAHPRRGVLYPLQSFTSGRVVDLSEVPFFVEGSCVEVASIIVEVA